MTLPNQTHRYSTTTWANMPRKRASFTSRYGDHIGLAVLIAAIIFTTKVPDMAEGLSNHLSAPVACAKEC